MLEHKTVILGVSGSIAAYKAASLASALVKLHADVYVIMTANATNFIHPITFETLTGHRCLVDTFDRNFEFQVEHVALAAKADLMIIAPATANVIAKLAHGISDDMLTTTALALQTAPLLIAPAMNTNMLMKQVTQDNIKILKEYGHYVISPAEGYLACGAIGAGKMPEPEALLEEILYFIGRKQILSGKKILITAGPTREMLDPVRFISNFSTGKMGYELAKNAARCGAEVTLISGPSELLPPSHVTVVGVTSASDMEEEVMKREKNSDIVIMSAAVADYTPTEVCNEKIKKSDATMTVSLQRTTDILATLGKNKRSNQFLCGFSMETEHLIENSRKKLLGKNLDMIVANSIRQEGAGFGGDTNIVHLISKKDERELPLMSKNDVAYEILKEIACKL